ncbi:MAG TPA: phosphoribosyltransferase family protein [Candidatus Limnocylindrales bacterium]|nr:phosphoribosyltransferase family protein [Candidatus Limnocylindrales bacterium]
MAALLDLLLPPVCPGCEEEGAPICTACLRVLGRRLGEPPGAPIGLPVELPHGLVQLEWCAAYTGVARAAVHALKYDGERRLVGPLGGLLAERWGRAGIGADLVTWVPVHTTRRRDRGFDQAEILARETAARLGLPVLDLLARRRTTEAQHALGRGARARNVGGVFAVRGGAEPLVAGRWILVVDDVVTTGATLAAAAAALEEGGALAVSGLAFARER